MTVDSTLRVTLLITLSLPIALLGILGLSALLRRPWAESSVGALTRAVMFLTVVSTLGAVGAYAVSPRPRTISYGHWFAYHGGGFSVDLAVDALSLGFALLSVVICAVVAAFSNRYLHREPGYLRYFVLFATFTSGIVMIALAGSIELLFVGWELVGLSSALLVGFFHERPSPVRSALHVFAIYRISDAAMLSAAVLLHREAGSGSLSLLFSANGRSTFELSTGMATTIAALLVAAVAGKSGLLPFSSWLPRAMEGPTPSSAVYYGSLSIHAGCFLLLRAGPLLEQSSWARGLAVIAGISTAGYAALVGRVQTDVKSGLAYAALTQVGIIIVEVGLGLYVLAFVHMVGHACFRLLQFLSAPNVLHDLRELENLSGSATFGSKRSSTGRVPSKWRSRLFLFALERGFIDVVVQRGVVIPFLRFASLLDRLDRRLCRSGRRSAIADASSPLGGWRDD